MSATSVRPEVEVEPKASTLLKRNALGLPALFFCIATAAAPMTSMLFNVPVIVSGAGWAVPAAFVVALAMLLVFTVGYVEMARRVTSAGGFYSFVSHGFGQTAGLGTASVITFSDTILTAALVGVFAYFAKTTIQDWTGANIPVLLFLLAAVAVNVLFAYLDIKLTARVLAVFFVPQTPSDGQARRPSSRRAGADRRCPGGVAHARRPIRARRCRRRARRCRRRPSRLPALSIPRSTWNRCGVSFQLSLSRCTVIAVRNPLGRRAA